MAVSKRIANNCPVLLMTNLLGKKWTVPILKEIYFDDKKSFNNIQRALKFITPKVLSKYLKDMETKSVLIKTASTKNKRGREYSLTDKGISLLNFFNSLNDFCELCCPSSVDCKNSKCSECFFIK